MTRSHSEEVMDYMRLADDGCPNTPEHIADRSEWLLYRDYEFPVRRVFLRRRPFPFLPIGLSGDFFK